MKQFAGLSMRNFLDRIFVHCQAIYLNSRMCVSIQTEHFDLVMNTMQSIENNLLGIVFDNLHRKQLLEHLKVG